MVLNATFNNIVAVSFIGGGNYEYSEKNADQFLKHNFKTYEVEVIYNREKTIGKPRVLSILFII
jgi:hypothetical protein